MAWLHVVRRRAPAAVLDELDEVGEQRRERLHFGRIAFEDVMVSPRTVMRAVKADPGRGGGGSSARSHDERHVHALGRRQSDLRLVCHAAIVPRGTPRRCDVTEPTRARRPHAAGPCRTRPARAAAPGGDMPDRRASGRQSLGLRRGPPGAHAEGERVERDGLPGDGLRRPRARRPLGRKGVVDHHLAPPRPGRWPRCSGPLR